MNSDIFHLMNHAKDMQRISTEGLKRLNDAIAQVKKISEALPAEARAAAATAVKKEFMTQFIKPVDDAQATITKAADNAQDKINKLTIALTILAIVVFFAVLGLSYLYGGLIKKDIANLQATRDEIKAEIRSANYELSKTANVRRFTSDDGEEQFWVEIDHTQQTGVLEGKTWARMPVPLAKKTIKR